MIEKAAIVLFWMVMCVGLVGCNAQATEPVLKKPWIIDPHTHFKGADQVKLESQKRTFHPRSTLGKVVVPEDYRAIANRLGIQATVVVEAVDQENPEFNDWVLKQADSDLICGYIARGDLTSPQFAANHARYSATGFLRGYRFRLDELQGYLENKVARSNLKVLEKQEMVIDLLVDHSHWPSVMTLAREFPGLTVVLDHCLRARVKNGQVPQEWEKAVEECGKYANVNCKLSSLLNFADVTPFTEQAPTDLKFYRPILQTCFDAFGEDRVVFATNWAVCTHYGSVDDVVRLVSEFLQEQGEPALRKGMRENAIRVFKIRNKDLR
ncbi:MAG: amidohydrolase family protein [Planctomycetota bacterium]